MTVLYNTHPYKCIHSLFCVVVSDVSEPLAPPHQSHSGYLLWRDDKLRWHRCWCKAESRDMRFYIYEDTNEEILLRSFTLENVTVRYMHKGQTADSEKDNCLILSGILYDALGESSGNKMEASITPIDVCFAAYTDSEYKKWKDVLKLLQVNVVSSRDSTRISLLLDGNPWSSAVAHDSASSSSSNFSSNRDSIVSNTSSLHNTHRMSSRSDLGEGKEFGEDTKSLSLSKQLQPLPSPPHQIQVYGQGLISEWGGGQSREIICYERGLGIFSWGGNRLEDMYTECQRKLLSTGGSGNFKNVGVSMMRLLGVGRASHV